MVKFDADGVARTRLSFSVVRRSLDRTKNGNTSRHVDLISFKQKTNDPLFLLLSSCPLFQTILTECLTRQKSFSRCLYVKCPDADVTKEVMVLD